MVKVSVIIPIHNSELYLRECLDSVVVQDLLDMEFLCIDDDSTDQTAEILKEYASADSRIRLIYDPDGSYGHKINRGIMEAKGKYIGIIESDDRVAADMFSTLYQYAEENIVDYIKSDYYAFVTTPRGTYQTISNMVSDPSLYGKVLDIESNPLLSKKVAIGIWTGLYNRDFLIKHQIYLNETPGASYQDTGFCFFTAMHASRAYYLNQAFYYYRTDNAGSSVKDEKKSLAIVDEFNLIASRIPKNTERFYSIQSAYYIQKFLAYWWNIGRLSENGRLYFVNTVINDLLQDMRMERINLDDLASRPQKFFRGLQGNPEGAMNELKKQERNTESMYREIIEQLLSGRETVLFGAGKFGAKIAALDDVLHTNSLKCVCDNDSNNWGNITFGKMLVSPQDAVHQYPGAAYIIASKHYSTEIKKQLQQMDIKDEQIFICNEYTDLITLLSYCGNAGR